jgi:hypothetical protein
MDGQIANHFEDSCVPNDGHSIGSKLVNTDEPFTSQSLTLTERVLHWA